MPEKTPLIILGLDAGDPQLIRKFTDDGDMPTIRSIMDRGWHARTSGPELFAEHGVWTSIFSGLTRAQTGFYYFRQLKPGTYDVVSAGVDFDAPPFWKALAGGNRKAAIIDVPETDLIKGLPGVQVMNRAIHLGWVSNDPAYAPQCQPSELLRELDSMFGQSDRIVENSNASIDDDKALLKRLLAQVEGKGALCRHVLAKDRHDLIVSIFHEVHTAAHQFWKYRPEAQGSDDARDDDTLRDGIRAVYAATDREMGKILAQLPADANVCVIGSIGLKDYCPTPGLGEMLLRRLGYQTSPPKGKTSFRPMDLARRLLPESIRIALSKRLPREARERIVAEQFRSGTDWSRTTAFALPTFYKTFIFVNLRGRQPNGIVEPGKPYMDLLNQLELDLRGLIDPRTGTSPIASIDRAVDLFGKDAPRELPDLFVEWNAPHFLSRLIHPRCEITMQRPEWYRPSDHTQNGFVAAMGPAFQQRGNQPDIVIPDLAPTFLKLLSVPVPPGLTGRPLPVMR